MKSVCIKTLSSPYIFRKYHFILKGFECEVWVEKFSVVSDTGYRMSYSLIRQKMDRAFKETVIILEQIRERK